MNKFLLCLCISAFSLSCNNDKESEKTAATSTNESATTSQAAVDLPFKASYSSSFSNDVSDADLKTVLMSYKDWSDGNIDGLKKAMGDSVEVDMSSGDHFHVSNADLMKRWTTYRDSLSSVKIEMAAWQKMYSTDKKQAFVVTWYDETDTYKNGKVDSAAYHDINLLKDGKIVFYSQYKRPKK